MISLEIQCFSELTEIIAPDGGALGDAGVGQYAVAGGEGVLNASQ